MDKKSLSVPVIALSALLAVSLGVIVFLMVGAKKQAQTVTVPNVTMVDEGDAQKAITNAGLRLGTTTEQNSENVPRHHVISQDPAAGTHVDGGTAVNIVVSKGKEHPDQVTVPDLKGMTQEDAEKALTDAKLVPVPGNPEYSDEVEPGKVCKQSVAAGTTLDEGSQVVFSTSLGKESVIVPDVTGMPVDQARNTMNEAGLGTDTTSAYSDSVTKDSVMSQSVDKGTKVVKGTVVTLQVSLGAKPTVKVQVPNILTYTLDDAKAALDSAGLKYQYTGDVDGTVASMNPQPGTEVDQGSTVSFTLQHHASLVAVPDVSGMNGTDAKAAMKQAGLDLDYDVRNPDRELSGTNPAASTMVDVGTMVEAVYDPEPKPTPQPGGWETNANAASHVTDYENQIFEQATEDTGNDAKPVAVVATQATSDENYAFLGYQDQSWCVFEVTASNSGDASLVSAHPIDVANVVTTKGDDGGAIGGWAASGDEAYGLDSGDAADAFNEAASSWTGVSLNPIALLGQQVTDGITYKVLCAGSAVTPDAQESLYVVTLQVGTDGSASFTDVATLDLINYLG